MGLGVLALVSWIFGIMMAVAQDLPQLENRAQYERAENSVVYDRNGTRLATLTNNEGRILVESDEIAPVMKEAVVAIEDQRFYEHRGVDFQGIARALYQDVLAGSAEQGASTITQQFVKNALAAQDDRTIFQKLREAALAYQLERNWSKDKIITEYLNSIYFGEGAYGIEAAARDLLRLRPRGLRRGGPAHLRVRAPALRGRAPRRDHRLARRLLARAANHGATPRRAATSSSRTWRRRASSPRRSTRHYTSDATYPLPHGSISSPRPTTPPPRTSPPGCASSSSTSTAPARPSAAASRSSPLSTSSSSSRSRRSPRARVAGVGLDSSVVVLDNETAGVLAMVGGYDYQRGRLQPRHQRAAPARLRVQAVHARHRPRAGPLDRARSTPRRRSRFPFRVKVSEKGGGTEIVNELFEPANYEDSYLGSASLATGTTYSDNSVYAQVGMQVGPENIAETAGKHGHQHRPLDRERVRAGGPGLRAVQPGPDPRRPRRA